MSDAILQGGSPSRRLIALVTAFLVGAFIAGGLYWFGMHESDEGSGGGLLRLQPTVLNPDDPTQPLLTDGTRVTLAQAQAARPFPIYRPQHPTASDQSMTQVWMGASEVALRYSSGVRVYLRVWPPGKDPASSYATQAQESGVGEVVEINGQPAWIAEADSLSPGNPRYSFVDMSIGHVQILFSASVTLADLTEMASTVSGKGVQG